MFFTFQSFLISDTFMKDLNNFYILVAPNLKGDVSTINNELAIAKWKI